MRAASAVLPSPGAPRTPATRMRGGPAVSEAGSVALRAASTCNRSRGRAGAASAATAASTSGVGSAQSRSGTGAPSAAACGRRSASSRRKRGSTASPWRSATISTRQSSGSGVSVATAGTSCAWSAAATWPASPRAASSGSIAACGGGTARRSASGVARRRACAPGRLRKGCGRSPQAPRASSSGSSSSERRDPKGEHRTPTRRGGRWRGTGSCRAWRARQAASAMAESWWPSGPPPASVRRRWLKNRASSARVSVAMSSTAPRPSARSRAAQ